MRQTPAPARIEQRLGRRCLKEGFGVHVADEDGTVLAHQCRGELVLEGFPAVGYLGVQRPCEALVAGLLGNR